ncbi:hypothetical protein WA1_37770 [Scytonema hofmannii PCC 7110]|uniref:Uncharacterized protein n=1 Tax=Scytonema hofmannii PCC 7110 TaxID=128403 RepID=A0A139X0E5_9CYAN|nr:hypothetical protein [Scytonema hofmannii]KYC38103.1 hypothetical protein WA1_37770 [Scytonema hofmannii PCC 7110]
MIQCPVCHTKYIEEVEISCSTCGWDLTPYPLTFSGQLPEEFLEKEQAKLAWARQIWAQSQQQIQQLQKENSQLQFLLERAQSQIEKYKKQLERMLHDFQLLETNLPKLLSPLLLPLKKRWDIDT